MSKKNKKQRPVSEPVERFTKQGFLLSEEFERDKGVLQYLLSDKKQYSVEEVRNILDKFKHERVK